MIDSRCSITVFIKNKNIMLITCCERNYMHYDWTVKQDKFPLRPDVVVAESPKILREQLSGCIKHYEQ